MMSTGRLIGVVPSGRRILKVSVVAFGSTLVSNVARYCCMSILFKEVMERENFGTEGTGGQGPQQQQVMLMMICLPQWEVTDVGESFISEVLSVPGIIKTVLKCVTHPRTAGRIADLSMYVLVTATE